MINTIIIPRTAQTLADGTTLTYSAGKLLVKDDGVTSAKINVVGLEGSTGKMNDFNSTNCKNLSGANLTSTGLSQKFYDDTTYSHTDATPTEVLEITATVTSGVCPVFFECEFRCTTTESSNLTIHRNDVVQLSFNASTTASNMIAGQGGSAWRKVYGLVMVADADTIQFLIARVTSGNVELKNVRCWSVGEVSLA